MASGGEFRRGNEGRNLRHGGLSIFLEISSCSERWHRRHDNALAQRYTARKFACLKGEEYMDTGL